MAFLSDIEIAQATPMKPITEIAKVVGIHDDYLEPYGKYKAKIDYNVLGTTGRKNGKLVLVTAITPTPAGEGKTTTTIGLADGLRKIGKNSVVALREPSLGPVFGVKGGAAGGGYAQVVPMEDINLHFTGDFHAIGAANNLLAAMLDNHIYQGNALNIDPRRITWRRCVDMNDRQLRFVTDGLGGRVNGVPREDGYDITVASEIMAVFCLASDIDDLKERLSRIVVGYTYDEKPVTAGQLKAVGAMAALLKDALKPNLVQTLEGTPAFVHGGPFANIAHGCNSIVATRLSMSLAEYTVTEAGFGADLGAEKFFDVKCRVGNLQPNAVVLVATIPALKLHGGADKENLYTENVEAVKAGIHNMLRHVDIIRNVYELPLVVTINKYATDTEEEIDAVKEALDWLQIPSTINDAWGKGGKGCEELAELVQIACEKDNSNFKFAYDTNLSIDKKIKAIATKVYGAKDVEFSDLAKAKLKEIKKLKMEHYPVVIAKTQYSLSDNPKLIGSPEDFNITIRDLEIRSGAEFIVAIAGNMMLMPGLGKTPAFKKMTIDSQGKIDGLF